MEEKKTMEPIEMATHALLALASACIAAAAFLLALRILTGDPEEAGSEDFDPDFA